MENSGLRKGRTFVPNQVIIKLKNDKNPKVREALQRQLGAKVTGTTQTLGIELWTIPDNIGVEEVVKKYSKDRRIEFIEPNYTDATLALTPNDPQFSKLWALNNTGQTGGTFDADIDALEAWNFVPPEPGVIPTGGNATVGVIDTGVDYNHPDLNDNIWINTDEIPNNGIDDDNNGYIDDFRGWDFVNNDNNPMDGHSHGTHVAGTIGAEGDNGIGVVGVNWDVKIMPLKIFSDSGGSAGNFAIIQAIEYAANNGADLTNNSWGGGGFSAAMHDAIENGPLFVAAAGNNGSNNDTSPFYPASYDLDNIISVAATDHKDRLAAFSNYGHTSVDLGAPGFNIYSTIPGNSYGNASGTSMAAPHVSGAAALMVGTRRDRGLPDLTTLDLRQRVLDAVDTIPALYEKTVTGGRLNLDAGIHQQGIGWGDVHLITFDDKKYNLQSFGEFILAETARDGDDWVVQTRQEPWVINNLVSVNTAFATLVDGKKVIFDLDLSNKLKIDGNNVSLSNGNTLTVGNSEIKRSGNEYTITYAGDDGIVDAADVKLIAIDKGNHINITISHFGIMQGLLGNNDGNPDNDFALRDGTQLPSNLSVQDIHGKYADSWRVGRKESLFGNSEDVLIGNPERFISLDDFNRGEIREVQQKALSAGIPKGEILDAVTLDLLATGDERFLDGAVELFVTETPEDNAGVTVSPTKLKTSEDGTQAKFDVVLDSKPKRKVVVKFTSNDLSEGVLNKKRVVFTPNNWNKPKTLRVKGVNDPQVDGDIRFTISGKVNSSDANYKNVTVKDIAVVNVDNDDVKNIKELLKDAKLYPKGFKEGRIGVGRIGSDLVVDSNQNGVFDEDKDCEIEDFFKNDKGKQKGPGYINRLGNRTGQQLLGVPEIPDIEELDKGGKGLKEARTLGSKKPPTADSLINFTSSGVVNTEDWHEFILPEPGVVNLSLDGLSANVDLELYDDSQSVLQGSSSNSGTSPEEIETFLTPGTYAARVVGTENTPSPYDLSIVG
ncbi:MAG: S8 family serine peptidase [Cyanobacteriota bacterium]|nr:S8 family serine peptidase [Cyanobacteriota bacterium]